MRRPVFIPLGIALLLVSYLSISRPNRAVAAPSTARRALDMVMPDLNLTGATLGDALDFVQDVSGANMHVNWAALEAAGVSKETPINVRLKNVPLRKVLDLLLSESSAGAPLTYYVDQGVIEVTTRDIADKELITRVYRVDDLILEVPDFTDAPDFNLQNGNGGGRGGGGGGSGPFSGGNGSSSGNEQVMTRTQRAQSLIDTIVAAVQPEVWQANGGNATIRFFNGSLIITAPRSVHEALAGPVD